MGARDLHRLPVHGDVTRAGSKRMDLQRMQGNIEIVILKVNLSRSVECQCHAFSIPRERTAR